MHFNLFKSLTNVENIGDTLVLKNSTSLT